MESSYLAASRTGLLARRAEEISVNCYVNIMDQYRPAGKADDFAELEATITAKEYRQAVQRAQEYGLTRLDNRNFSNLFRHLLDL